MELCIYYHFARPGDARGQARRFVELVGPLEPRERLCLDLEAPIAATTASSLRWVDDFYSELMGGACSDRRPFLYTSKNKWDEICGKNKPWLLGTTDVDLWAKRYSSKAGLEPLIPAPWKDRGWHVWQFSDSKVPPHSIAGVGPCDGDVWTADRARLRAYVNASVIVAPPVG
jgi:GH25 family lysozyme M1 (1,4-beta-N-acetylmuramidase)